MANGKGPYEVAVVGSGPSGFYAAEALIRSETPVRVTMIERLPSPFGLVRSGVAPDHPKLKEVIRVYDRIARSEEFRYFGNTAAGPDVTVEELRDTFHAVVLAYGTPGERSMDIPGEELPGSHAALDLVGWYNGHPDYQHHTFDLSHESVAIIGQGNVATDLCRILAKPVDELRHTDITEHALEVLAESRVRDIHVIGRRGPAQARFTPKELRELGELTDCPAVVDEEDLVLNEASERELADPDNTDAQKNVELFRGFTENKGASGRRTIRFHFHSTPEAIFGQEHVTGLRCTRNQLVGGPFAQGAEPTGETWELPCGLVFRSIGHRGVPLPGVPFNERTGTVPHRAGRVVNGNHPMPGLYVTGWLKRGATGIIGTNRADSLETVATVLDHLSDDAAEGRGGADALEELLQRRGVQYISYIDWQTIDACELERGEARGKPREKFTTVEDMLAPVERTAQGSVPEV